MSSSNVNTTVKRFESDGILNLNDGTNDFVVKNINPGSLEFSIPVRKALEYGDRGTMKVPLEGDDEYGDFKVTVKAAQYEATGLIDLVNANGATSGATAGQKKSYTITVKVPDARGATTGTLYTFTSSVFTENAKFKAGADFDTVEITGKFITFAKASY